MENTTFLFSITISDIKIIHVKTIDGWNIYYTTIVLNGFRISGIEIRNVYIFSSI